MTDTTEPTTPAAAEPAPLAGTVPPPPPAPAPEKPKLTVKRVKSAAPVVALAKGDADASDTPEGTRTETDAGPVQGTNFLAEPREIEELVLPTLTIKRVRY